MILFIKSFYLSSSTYSTECLLTSWRVQRHERERHTHRERQNTVFITLAAKEYRYKVISKAAALALFRAIVEHFSFINEKVKERAKKSSYGKNLYQFDILKSQKEMAHIPCTNALH